MGGFGDEERLLCLDAQTGRQKWSVKLGKLLDNDWGNGPRGTPSVDGNMVYALSATGGLVAADRNSGRIVWRVMMQDFGGEIPKWGYSESPLVEGNRLIVTPGGKQGAVIALDKLTGKLIWQSKAFTDFPHYASAIAVDHNGQRQIIQLFMSRLIGVNAENGDLLWDTHWDGKVAVIPTPIYKDGKVFITSGYGIGCKLVEIGDNKPKDVYQNKIMKNHHGGVILLGDHLYGHSDGAGWLCMDFATGKEIWRVKDKLGKGAIGYADGRFYCLDEKTGEVALLEASSDGYKEHGRFTLDPQTKLRKPKGRIWMHPVIVNGKLYLRDQELLFCFDVKK